MQNLIFLYQRIQIFIGLYWSPVQISLFIISFCLYNSALVCEGWSVITDTFPTPPPPPTIRYPEDWDGKPKYQGVAYNGEQPAVHDAREVPRDSKLRGRSLYQVDDSVHGSSNPAPHDTSVPGRNSGIKNIPEPQEPTYGLQKHDKPEVLRGNNPPNKPASSPWEPPSSSFSRDPEVPPSSSAPVEVMVDLTNERIDFIEVIVQKVAAMAQGLPKVSDDFIKQATIITVKHTPNLTDWLATTQDQVSDNNHEVNLRLGIITRIMVNPNVSPLEIKILNNLATTITILNAANALHVTDPHQINSLLSSELYSRTFEKFGTK